MSKLIFHVGCGAGFYSEFNNMVLAILYCQRHGIQFELYSKDANFGQKEGWRDFFEPFCKENTLGLHHYINRRSELPTGKKKKIYYRIYKLFNPHVFLTFELWDKFRHIDQTELSTKETQTICKPIVEKIYRFNKETKEEIANLMDTISIPKPYVGFHIRGGDKFMEHELLNVELYIKKAEQMTDIRCGFVSSDDYRNVEKMQELFPEWKFYTLTEKESQGYDQFRFSNSSSAAKRHDLINMFASMEYLRNADLTFCTYSSNIGEFLGMCMGDRAIGIDYDNWMIW